MKKVYMKEKEADKTDTEEAADTTNKTGTEKPEAKMNPNGGAGGCGCGR